MRNKIYFQSGTLIALLLLFSGCEKFLDEKSDKRLAVPATLADLQALLDNDGVMNHNMPGSGEISSDNYYLTDADYNSTSQEHLRRMYIWEKDDLFAPGSSSNDWNYLFKAVYAANSVLEEGEKIRTPDNTAGVLALKGQALFFRAFAYLDAVQIWTLGYDPATADTDLGLPLRLDPDFNKASARASLRQTYQQILDDIQIAIPLLPIKPLHAVRASKPAAYGLMARVFLNMRDYKQAGLYADSSLQLFNTLIDYNTLNAAAAYPLPRFNSEVIFERVLATPSMITKGRIHPDLYTQYASNDLRKSVFFRSNPDGSFAFKGPYLGTFALWGGLTSSEMLLIRAECAARNGNINGALSDLNTLMAKRWKAGTFVSITASTPDAALKLVLTERRKELLMRGLRWPDLKRLNKEGSGITLTRKVGGVTYILPPNDLRYALPIPEDVISRSGMTQNHR